MEIEVPSIELLNSLLAFLDINVVKGTKGWHFRTVKECRLVVLCSKQGTWRTVGSLEDITNALCKMSSFHLVDFMSEAVVDKTPFVKNPYLGCGSLEEMLVRRDLLA